jgi:hypothetical protein
MTNRWMMIAALLAAAGLTALGTAGFAQFGGQAPNENPNESGPVVIGGPGAPSAAMAPSRLERLLVQPGAVVTRGYTDLGGIQGDNGWELHVLAVEASASTGKVYGVALQMPGHAETLLDEEGIDPLLASLDALGKFQRDTGTKLNNSEGRYRTPAGLEIANVDSNGMRLATVRIVQVIWPTGQVAEGSMTFRPQRLEELGRLVKSAKERIATAKGG